MIMIIPKVLDLVIVRGSKWARTSVCSPPRHADKASLSPVSVCDVWCMECDLIDDDKVRCIEQQYEYILSYLTWCITL